MSVIIVQPVFVKKCTKQGKFFIRVRLCEEGGKEKVRSCEIIIDSCSFFTVRIKLAKIVLSPIDSPSLLIYFLACPSGSRLTNQHHLTVCFLGRYRMGSINQSASPFGLASWILLQ